MNYEIQENTELDKLREQLKFPDSVELLECREKSELPKHNYETVKLSEGLEVDSRSKEVSHDQKTPFVYTKDYISSDGRYIYGDFDPNDKGEWIETLARKDWITEMLDKARS